MNVYKNIKCKKSMLVIGIILFVVFMGLGLLIYSGEVNAEYEVLTKNTSENVYAKLNVSLLDSAFATETLDGKEKDYYIAFDENDNPFIIVLNKSGLESLRKIQEYTLSETEIEKPNPVMVYGNVSKSDTEVFKYLQEFLKDEDGNTYTIDELKSVVGENYLDTTWDNKEEGIFALILFGVFSLSGLILIIVYFVRNKKSKKILEEYERELKNINIHVSGKSDVVFDGDYKWECEAITNILKNGIEYSKDNGDIYVNYKDNGMYVSIDIIDNGKGICNEDMKHIFDRFYKKNNNSNNFGIGLSLAKEIIERDNGTIRVSSNNGTKFSIRYYK